MSDIQIYVVDDEAEIRHSIVQFLELEDYQAREFEEGATVLNAISRDSAVVIVSDIRMPNMDGMELLSKIVAIDPSIPVILITGHGDVQLAVEAMQAGAYDFIEKPFDPERLAAQVKRAATARMLTLNNRELRNALADPDRLQHVFVGQSDSVVNIREKILDFAQSDDHVLIRGDIGTGRSLAARAIHAASQGARNPIQIVNCGASSDDEISERLFGGGSMQGAFLSPNPMTLVLDDIGALAQKLQLKLAEELSKSEDDDKPHIRVIAIETKPAENELARELNHRLSGKLLDIMPLRDRGGDILILFNWHFERFCADYGNDIPELDAGSAATLMTAPWPGNIRQLMKFAENAAMRVGNGESLESIIVSEFEVQNGSAITQGSPLKSQVDAFEEMLIRNALKRHRGSIANVLEDLSLPRRTLNEKMARYGLSRADFT